MAAVTVKIINGKYENVDAVDNVINYALRMGDMKIVGGYGVTLTSAKDIINQFYTVKKLYNRMNGKQVLHIMFSVDKTAYLNPVQVKMLGDLLGLYFAEDRQVVFGVHTDTEHMHIHMVINTIAFTNGSYKGYYEIEPLKIFANQCYERVMDTIWFGKPLNGRIRKI